MPGKRHFPAIEPGGLFSSSGRERLAKKRPACRQIPGRSAGDEAVLAPDLGLKFEAGFDTVGRPMPKRVWMGFVFSLILAACASRRIVTTPIDEKLSFGAHVSAGLPQSPDRFVDIWNPGAGIGAEARLHLSKFDALSVGFAVQTFGLDRQKYLGSVGPRVGATWEVIGGGSIQTSLLTVDYVRYFTRPRSGPGFYLLAGGGFYMERPKDIEIEATIIYPGFPKYKFTADADEPENRPGLNGGAGVELRLSSRIALAVESRYHLFFSRNENTSFLTVSGGLRIGI
jgi:hypothetical protein